MVVTVRLSLTKVKLPLPTAMITLLPVVALVQYNASPRAVMRLPLTVPVSPISKPQVSSQYRQRPIEANPAIFGKNRDSAVGATRKGNS